MINISKIHRLDNKYKYISGIYMIYSKNTGDIYIGSIIDLYKRYQEHRNFILNKNHSNYKIKKISHHYRNNFYFCIWELCDKNLLLIREQTYLNLLKEKTILLNINPIARSCLGVKRTAETKLKISKSKKGKPNNHNKKCKCHYCCHKGKYNANWQGGLTNKIYNCIICNKKILKSTWIKGSKKCYKCFRKNNIPWNKGLTKDSHIGLKRISDYMTKHNPRKQKI